MEYVPEGDLGKLIQEHGAISEPYVKIMARQLISALGYLHDNRITHRDVKPDNILIQSTSPNLVVKLTDFGLSKMIDTEQTFLKTFCGTLLYCAPEVYSEFSTYDDNGRRVRQRDRRPISRERYDHAVDVWSLGGVLFYALTGFPPFPVKNGITYTELLHHIMTNQLNIQPLMKEKVSVQGINFLTRMIDRRPETRATIAELQDHPWLTDAPASAADSFDEISDDGLEQRASQLSLAHGQHHGQSIDDMGSSDLGEPEPDLSMDFGDDKENYTFGQPPPPNRLWGEVSAIGSSMAINEDRLNIPMSATSLGQTEIHDPEILDSFESDDSSTPQQPRLQQTRGLLPSISSTTNGNTRSVALGMESQSLGGASSILENLNMKSVAHNNSNARSEISDVSRSKRKPAYDTSDEYEMPGSNLKPSFKRLKSKGDETAADVEDEYSLIASVPSIVKGDTKRQVDYPLHKTTFWDAGDKETWHLNYPEMTHSQYTAFKAAAHKRSEDFSEGNTPLWDIAMEWFPPTSNKLDSAGAVLETRPFLRRDSRSVESDGDWDVPPTAPVPEDDQDSIPDTLPPDTQIPGPVPNILSPKRVIARLTSSAGSLVRGISISVTDPILSWGRARDNTTIYQHVMEMKIPKYAFKILLWRDGYTASANEFRPWDRGRSPGMATMRASPEPDSYAFYISTKATNGLRINGITLSPNEPKDLAAPSRYWMKLHTGDTIVCWGTEDVNNQARLDFECFWGGSSALRPSEEAPTCVPEAVARKLDSTWTKVEKNLHHDRVKEKATQEQVYRMKNMALEEQRSQKFQLKREEALRIMAERGSRQASPMSAPPIRGRTVPRFRQGSPAELTTQ
jgi:serine/threonine protein kinase